MLIALDYDDTFTRDPEAWLGFAKLMKSRGHEVIGVTMRYPGEASGMDSRYADACPKTHFTGRQAKKQYLEGKGVFPHIWIDDTPEWILVSAKEE